MLDSLETYWLRAFSEADGGGGLSKRAGHRGRMLYEAGIANKRAFRRYTYEVVVECSVLAPGEFSDAEITFPAITQNVSRFGLALLSNNPLAVGRSVRIHFTHLQKGFDRYHVVWTRKTRDGTYLSGLHLEE